LILLETLVIIGWWNY